MIWVVLFALSIAIMALILPSVLRRVVVPVSDGHGVFAGQLEELGRDLELGMIDESEFRAAELDIRRRAAMASKVTRVADSADRAFRTIAIAGTGVTVLLAMIIYLSVGRPDLVGQVPPRQAELPPELQEVLDEVAAVAQFMESNPDNAEGWSILSQAYLSMGRYREAIVTLDNLIDLRPGIAEYHAMLGQAHLLAEGGLMSVAAREATMRALELDPAHPRARFFAAEALFQDGDENGAVAAWQALLAAPEADSDYRRMVEARLAAISMAAEPD